ncbi:MAG TPA: Ig-like domain repeat protein, partial [Anaerolineales bacterium]|nr:Ig-like domain repeat protein [Anaerolineales bacterium]
MTKKFRIATFKLMDILMILSMVLASPINVAAAPLAQDPTPVLATDQADYAPGASAHVTGTGFTAGDYIIAVNGSDMQWTVTADSDGNFASDSPALDSGGSYEVRAYASGWSGDWSEAPVASTSFTVTAPPDPTQVPTDAPTDEPTAVPTDTVTATEPPTAAPTDTPLPTDTALPPTDTPTNEPTATEPSTATATTAPTDTPTAIVPPTITSDKADYAPGELVTLTGQNWQGDTTVTITVVDAVPTVYHDTDQVQVQPDGTISDSFNLPTTFVDRYFVTAKGVQTGRTATTTFTDLSIGTYDQCSNDTGTGYTSGDTGCRWINGNLQSSNSHYAEGDATVQRLWLTDLAPGSSHTIVFDYGTTKGGKHAYDFLTTWNWSESWITDADRCQDITGCTGASDTFTNIPNDPNVPDTFEPNTPGSRQFVMRGGTLTGAAFAAPIPFTGSYASDSDTRISITFTVSPGSGAMCTTDNKGVTTCGVALWFGAHVAAQANWGLGLGAGSISGSPYHVSLVQLDGASVGSRDNQMQASAVTVVPNGTIVIVKDAVPNSPQDFNFTLTNNSTITQNFSLDDDADATLPSSQTFSVPPGAWTATELSLPTGWTLTNLVCSDPTNNTTVSLATRTATINLASSETVTCTYTDTFQKANTSTATTIHDAAHNAVTSVALGTTVHDSATVSGTGFGTPTGSVTFTFYTTSAACTGTSVAAGTVTLDGTGVAHPSTGQGPLTAGSYSFQATYSGDGNYNGSTSPCEPLTVGKANTTTSTEIHDGTHAVVTSVALGTTVHDSATVSGSGFGTPTGSVTFTFYTAGDQCTGASVAAGTVTLDGSGVAHPSSSEGPLAAGSYSFQATYSGDGNYNGSTSPCEPLTVGKANTSTSTEIHDATHAAVTSVALGTTVHDSATVSGTGFGTPTGSVTFTFYTAGDQCTGSSVAAGTVALASGVAHPSSDEGPLAAGSYSFQATYSGDGNYNGSTSPCEPLTVGKANTSTVTTIHDATHNAVTSVALGTTVHDSATVNGSGFGTPTGSVTFTFFTTSDQCTGDSVAAGSITLDASGIAHPSDPFGPLAAGSYSFQATYSGDNNYNASTSDCEPLTVNKAQLTITTTVHDGDHNDITNQSVPLGTSAHDNASVTGAVAGFPIPAISFTFNSNPIANGSTEAGFEATSVSTSPLGAGSYNFNASVGSNANYIGDTSDDEPFTVEKADSSTSTTIHDADHNAVTSVALGSTVHDSATVTGTAFGFPTGSVTFTFFTAGNQCSGASVAAGTVTLDASGVAHPSSDEGPLAAGSYSFQATYSGDDNYSESTSPCEPLTVSTANTSTSTEIHDETHAAVTSVALGTTVHDSATVSGSGFGTPTGSVTFTFYTASDQCTDDSVAAGTVTLDASGVAHPSDAFGPLAAGSYSFQATYSGDSNYEGSTSPCEPLTVNKAQLTITTTVHDVDHNDITNQSVSLGTSAHDNASVSGAVSGFPIPAISFTFNGNPIANDSTEGSFAATSISTGPLGAGSYNFNASVASDSNYIGDTSEDEPFTVEKADSSTATTIHDADHNAATSVALGSTVHDSATVTGTSFGTPTGNVTFTFYTASDQCTGASVGASTVALSGGVAHPSSDEGPLAAGSYSFQATYSGDSNYNESTSPCEPLTVSKSDSNVVTEIHDAAHNTVTSVALGITVHDQAAVSGTAFGTPTGSVTFTFFTTSDQCTGDSVAAGTVALDASGVAHPSSNEGPLAAGSYSFQATYSGDDNYNASTSPCEPLTVNKAQLTITTTVHDGDHNDITNQSVALGSSAHDNATVSGAVAGFPIPAISFTFNGNPIANDSTEGSFDATSVSTG